MIPKTFSRREFLRAGGVALALPYLDAMTPSSGRLPKKRRMVCIMTPLGIHSENLFPAETGRGYTATRYLKELDGLRYHFTVFSGLSHPGVDGGHNAERSFLTAAAHPAEPTFRNTISLDQFAAEQMGAVTRFASLQLSTSRNTSLAWTRGGVQIPAEDSPSKLFGRMFLTGSPEDIEREKQRLQVGQSIMDTLGSQAKRFQRSLGRRDQDKLEEYFTSVRETEQKLAKAEDWIHEPKPTVDVAPFQDIAEPENFIGRTRLMYDLIHLALQTDSTRVVTLNLQGSSFVVIPIPGVTIAHHDLSHHGLDPQKLRELALVEQEEIRALGEFLTKLNLTEESGDNLLDQSMVLFGSNLGNASSHDNRNLPIIVAGGGFRHGQHLAFDPKNPPPLSNLYVQMLQQLGLEAGRFATSDAESIAGFHS